MYFLEIVFDLLQEIVGAWGKLDPSYALLLSKYMQINYLLFPSKGSVEFFLHFENKFYLTEIINIDLSIQIGLKVLRKLLPC
jgi:hypothetical protein